jgi:hypothetical protein
MDYSESESEESYDSDLEEYMYKPDQARGLSDFLENEKEEPDLRSSFDELQMRRQKGNQAWRVCVLSGQR